MLRIRQYELGGPEVLRVEEAADLAPGAGQVRIAVEAAGVHLLDTTIRRGESPTGTQPQLPMTPGREVAGTVDALARAADGSRVPYVGSAFPLRDAAEAHRALEAGKTTGKVVLVSARMAR